MGKRKEKMSCKKKRQEPKKNTGSKEETEDLVKNIRKTTRGSKRCRRLRSGGSQSPPLHLSLKKNLKRTTKGPTPSQTESLPSGQPSPKREARDRKNWRRKDPPEKRNSTSSRGQGGSTN